MQADDLIQFLFVQWANPRFFFRKLYILVLRFILFSLICGIVGTTLGWFSSVAHAAIPICTNSVSGGVYLDANANGVREPTESFLAGAIQVVNRADLPIDSFQSPNGLFVLNNLACDEYTVYHNGDYVGKLLVDEVIGEVLIELPKTNLTQHIFLPIIN